MNNLIDELEEIYNEIGNIMVRAYYKTSGGVKLYYDFQEVTETQLNGSYDMLEIPELIYYLEEQKYSMLIEWMEVLCPNEKERKMQTLELKVNIPDEYVILKRKEFEELENKVDQRVWIGFNDLKALTGIERNNLDTILKRYRSELDVHKDGPLKFPDRGKWIF